MRRGPELEPIVLTTEENNRFVEWMRRHKTSQALAMRARIVLGCQSGRSNREIAEQLRVTAQTVGKWRTRFSEKSLEGLLDEPRLCAPRTINDAVVEMVIAKTQQSSLSCALHSDLGLVAQLSRALVRYADRVADPSRHSPQLRRT